VNTSYLSFVAVPAIAAALIPFAAKIRTRFSELAASAALLAGLIAIIMQIARSYGSLRIGMAPAIPGNAFTDLMLLAIYMVGFAVTVFSAFYMAPDKGRGTYFALISLCVAGMSGVVAATDFFTLYVFVEIVAVCSFALIAFENNAESTEGALKYFFLSAPASLFLILSVALIMLYTGTTSFAGVQRMAMEGGSETALTIMLGMMMIAFLIKAGLIPFHAWTPDAYQSAPAPVSALLAGIVTKTSGIYALIKISQMLGTVYNNGTAGAVGKAVMFFGAVSIVGGALAALAQRSFKRMLAYSSISQMGYIAIAAGVGSPLAIAGAIFHLFNHATFKTTLFLNSAAVERAAGTEDMYKLGGLESRMKVTSWSSVIALLSTAGMPPLSGFWSKFIIILALWQAGAKGYAVIAIGASVLTLAYFIHMQRKVFFGRTTQQMQKVKEVSAGLYLPALVFALIMIVIGLYFPFIYSTLVEPAARITI